MRPVVEGGIHTQADVPKPVLLAPNFPSHGLGSVANSPPALDPGQLCFLSDQENLPQRRPAPRGRWYCWRLETGLVC